MDVSIRLAKIIRDLESADRQVSGVTMSGETFRAVLVEGERNPDTPVESPTFWGYPITINDTIDFGMLTPID